MKIRFGLALAFLIGLTTAGCAGGGGGAATSSATPAAGAGGVALQAGERPRENAETRAAERAIDQAGEAEDEAQAEALYQEAFTNAEAAMTADERNPLAHLLAGRALMGLNRYAEASAHLDRAEELRPLYQFDIQRERETAWMNLYQEAVPFVNSGDYEAAAEVFESANAIYDQRPEVMIMLGQIYAQLREHDKSIENLDRAMAVAADEEILATVDSATAASWQEQVADIPMTRASVLADAGRFEEAVSGFADLVAADPDNVVFTRNLAALLIQADQNDSAVVVLDGLMTRSDLSAQDYYTVGIGYYQTSAYERAAQAFAGAAERNVNDRDALEMWARSLQIDSIYDAVPAVADRWIALDPNSQTAHIIYAQAANQMGNTQVAADMIGRVEAMKVIVTDLQITRRSTGGATVSGSLRNGSATPGSQMTLAFTFYDEAGTAMGSANVAVTLPATDMSEIFRVDFDSADQVGGYGYTVSGM